MPLMVCVCAVNVLMISVMVMLLISIVELLYYHIQYCFHPTNVVCSPVTSDASDCYNYANENDMKNFCPAIQVSYGLCMYLYPVAIATGWF